MRDEAQSRLVAKLNALAESRLSGGWGKLPRDLDDRTAASIHAAMTAYRNIRNADGNIQVFFLPPAVALAVVRAIEPLMVPGSRPAPAPMQREISVAPDRDEVASDLETPPPEERARARRNNASRYYPRR